MAWAAQGLPLLMHLLLNLLLLPQGLDEPAAVPASQQGGGGGRPGAQGGVGAWLLLQGSRGAGGSQGTIQVNLAFTPSILLLQGGGSRAWSLQVQIQSGSVPGQGDPQSPGPGGQNTGCHCIISLVSL